MPCGNALGFTLESARHFIHFIRPASSWLIGRPIRRKHKPKVGGLTSMKPESLRDGPPEPWGINQVEGILLAREQEESLLPYALRQRPGFDQGEVFPRDDPERIVHGTPQDAQPAILLSPFGLQIKIRIRPTQPGVVHFALREHPEKRQEQRPSSGFAARAIDE